MNIVVDTETFPNCFLICAKDADSENTWSFEISSRKNDKDLIVGWFNWMNTVGAKMITFNGLGFDYPVLHFILTTGVSSPLAIYEFAKSVIDARDEDKFKFMVRPSDQRVPQIDLFKIHHFDNKARMTGLKALEFNMRLPNISDLPFPVGSILLPDEMDVLREYCFNDVDATVAFYFETKEKIEFREALSKQYNYDFTNCSDVKIGKQIFQMELEKSGVQCYTYGPDGRQPKQTKRPTIRLADCVPPYAKFETPEFERIRRHFLNTMITQTKGAFDDLVATVGGLEFKFGTGGIHASVENMSFKANDEMMIYDVDVTSLYPSLAIENGLYPEHLGPTFVDVYRRLKEQRLQHKKGTPENAALKLALNGVYGDSNNPFGIFYDPLFTMRITISGQLLIAMLAEQLLMLDGVKIIQANTDGISLWMPRSAKMIVDAICDEWERTTRLSLEKVEYSRMIVADVNSYIAVGVDGKVKRKGRYEYETEWHQDASALVISKVAEKVLLENAPIRETVENWPDLFDFMLRVKVPRSSRLVMETPSGDTPLENTQRYYVAKKGYPLVKIMPPLAKAPGVYRRIGIQKGYLACPCNNILKANTEVDFSYYVNEVEKLCLPVL